MDEAPGVALALKTRALTGHLSESFLCYLLAEYANRTPDPVSARVAGSFGSDIPEDIKSRRV